MQRIRKFIHFRKHSLRSCKGTTTLKKFLSMIRRHFTAFPEETYLYATDTTPSGTDTQMASTYFIPSPLYKLKLTDCTTQKTREMIFNELEGAYKFMKEVLNREDVKQLIARLQDTNKLHSIEYIRRSIYNDLCYEYRMDGLRMYVTLYK